MAMPGRPRRALAGFDDADEDGVFVSFFAFLSACSPISLPSACSLLHLASCKDAAWLLHLEQHNNEDEFIRIEPFPEPPDENDFVDSAAVDNVLPLREHEPEREPAADGHDPSHQLHQAHLKPHWHRTVFQESHDVGDA